MKTVVLNICNSLMAMSITRCLARTGDFQVCSLLPSCIEIAKECAAESADILLMEAAFNIGATLDDCLKEAKRLRSQRPECKTILLCDENSAPEVARRIALAKKDGLIDDFIYSSVSESYLTAMLYQIGLHGGVYYFRNDAKAQLVFHTAVQLTQEYDDYGFREFSKPADEPVMALSMAIHDCRPVEKEGQVIFFHAIYGRLTLNDNGDLCLDGVPCDAIVCHFATKNTYCFTYQYLSEMVNIRYLDPRDETLPDSFSIRKRTLKYDIKNWMKYSVKRVVRRILPRKISRA